MEQIVLRVETIDWTEGEHGHFRLTIREGCRVVIDWGDGHNEKIRGRGESCSFSHDYKSALPIRPFVVTITAEENGAIEEYEHGFIDMNTFYIDISGCPGLKRLDACGTNLLNIGKDNALEELTASMGTLNLEYCTHLKMLDISDSKIRALDIRCCEELRVINMFRSPVSKILWRNTTLLQKIVTDNALPLRMKPRMIERLEKPLERNNGKIEYYDFWEGMDELLEKYPMYRI